MIDNKATDAALAAAEAAAQAAVAAKDGAEIAFLDTVTHIKQINDAGQTDTERARLKSRFIGAFGYDRFAKLVARSR